MTTLTPAERLMVTMRLREMLEITGAAFEDVGCEGEVLALRHRFSELLGVAVRLTEALPKPADADLDALTQYAALKSAVAAAPVATSDAVDRARKDEMIRRNAPANPVAAAGSDADELKVF